MRRFSAFFSVGQIGGGLLARGRADYPAAGSVSRTRRCSSQPEGSATCLINRPAVRDEGWRPSRIIATRSGARKARGRIWLTYRSLTPSSRAISLRLLEPCSTQSFHQRRAWRMALMRLGSGRCCWTASRPPLTNLNWPPRASDWPISSVR